MNMRYESWKSLFLFCLGLFAGSAVCMKLLESGFYSNGRFFTIIGLELFYSREELGSVLSGLEEPARSLLRFQLLFDFAFMTGVYPGIAALCMMAAQPHPKKRIRKILVFAAFMQIPAGICDARENLYLLQWLKDPETISDLGSYHFVVWVKWILALGALILALPFLLRRKRTARTLV